MSELKLDQYQSNLMGEWVKDVTYQKMGEKTTVCLLKLKNGFEIVGTSACVNPADFNREIGEHYALVDALAELDGYAGFYRQMQGAEAKTFGVSINISGTDKDDIVQKVTEGVMNNLANMSRGMRGY